MNITNEIRTSLKREYTQYSDAISFYKKTLKDFERKYHVTTQNFLKKFEAGQVGDDADYFDWYASAKLLTQWQKSQAAIRSAVR